ncbi:MULTISPECIES: WD40 repeat domain-containing protein [unclassified Helicobacter]|uniref:WD40 repeat domain-containing protein n=1 Tax=unclassified Helicobacter TaxID=2593540 RepID=UPI000CF19B1F|nr:MULTISPECIES: WD40 repeat domain-containing protein [unclassified Helicobacter]
MLRILVFIFNLFIFGKALILTPQNIIDNQSEITSMQIHNHILYVSSINGKLNLYNLNSLKFQKSIIIPSHKDILDKIQVPKVTSTSTNNLNQTLITATNQYGSSNLFLNDKDLSLILENLEIIKTIWISDTQAIIALLSNEILLLDIPTKKIIYKSQISQSSLSDIVFSQDLNLLFSTGESGIIYAINPQDGTILYKINNIHKDKIFQLALAKQTLISGGEDRKVSIFNLQNPTMPHILKSSFLVYAVGINSNATHIAYMEDEVGNISLFSLQNHKVIASLRGMKGIINTILFYKDYMIVSCDESKIYFFNLKGVI